MAIKVRYALPILAAIISLGFMELSHAALRGQTKIIEVIPDYDAGHLTIIGTGFDDDTSLNIPIVTLGGVLLDSVFLDSPETIEGDIDLVGFPPGDYLLVVDPNFKKSQKAELLLTVGAVVQKQTCPNQQFMTGIEPTGTIICAAGFADCSNGVIDPGEVCDDANNIDGDGCSANCISNETCGNGVVDTINLEECDDGNTANGDGCSSVCKNEQLTVFCPCADYQNWNDVLANENFICGPAGTHWQGAQYFVYLDTEPNTSLLVIGNDTSPYCSATFADFSWLSLDINVTQLTVCANQILTKAAEHGTVCNGVIPY